MVTVERFKPIHASDLSQPLVPENDFSTGPNEWTEIQSIPGALVVVKIGATKPVNFKSGIGEDAMTLPEDVGLVFRWEKVEPAVIQSVGANVVSQPT
jgi:hypothetical protein